MRKKQEILDSGIGSLFLEDLAAYEDVLNPQAFSHEEHALFEVHL